MAESDMLNYYGSNQLHHCHSRLEHQAGDFDTDFPNI